MLCFFKEIFNENKYSGSWKKYELKVNNIRPITIDKKKPFSGVYYFYKDFELESVGSLAMIIKKMRKKHGMATLGYITWKYRLLSFH